MKPNLPPPAAPENIILTLPDMRQPTPPSALDEFMKKSRELEEMKSKAIAEVQAKRAAAWNVVSDLDAQLQELIGGKISNATGPRKSYPNPPAEEVLKAAVRVLTENKEGAPASKILATLGVNPNDVKWGKILEVEAAKKDAKIKHNGQKGRGSLYILK
jgi:hypothetical protein